MSFAVITGGGNVAGMAVQNALQSTATVTTAMTGHDGIAGVYLVLGPSTTVSPVYLQGTPNSIQGGFNQVAAEATSAGGRISTDKPFEAIGLPGEPKKIIAVYGDNITGMVNLFSGTIVADVLDKYGNPVSNSNVKFEVQDPPVYQGTQPPPASMTSAKLFKELEDCPGITSYGCQNATNFVDKMSFVGRTTAYVILGNAGETEYTIKASTIITDPDVQPSDKYIYFHHKTDYLRRRSEGQFDVPMLSLITGHIADKDGNTIDAGKPGQPFGPHLLADLHYIEEDFTIEYDQSSGTPGYYNFKGMGTFRTIPVTNDSTSSAYVKNGKVTFTVTNGGTVAPVTQATNTGGRYATTLTLAALPMKNTVVSLGSATVMKPILDPNTGAFSRMETNHFVTNATATSPSFTVWGVRPVVETGQLILINESGYSVADSPIRFRIEPPEYKPMSMVLFIYEKDTAGNEQWLGVIPADTNSLATHVITLSRGGAKFDPNTTYYAELVLNAGSAAEIVSEKVQLQVAQLALSTTEQTPKVPDEIKFGSGKNPEKKYEIAWKTATPATQCTGLEGTLKVVDKSGNLIEPPDDSPPAVVPVFKYAKAKYSIVFEQVGQKCIGKITVAGIKLVNIILTNKPMTEEELQALYNQGIVPLYGGIGNSVRVLAKNAALQFSIEPLGVIVLAIDGLRQDVLYTKDEQDVNVDQNGDKIDSPYYIPPKELKGLCDVLGGKIKFDEVTDPVNPDLTIVLPTGDCQENNWTDRHVKLPGVTAIFPSITYASWASIFTGKQAGETGIMGNEFFARDLYEAGTTFPGLSGSPLGMITYSDGAFGVGCGWTGWRSPLNKACFYSKYVLPADWHDGDGLKEKAIPRLTLQAPTVYEELAPVLKGFHTPPADSIISCDASEYECRSVVVFNHYAKGADRWRTMSGVLKPIWEYLTGGESNVMDSTPAAEAKSFINNYFSQDNPLGKHKRFPALFTVYFAGLDHEAHAEGMGKYREFFTDTTDAKIGVVIKALKDHDEFDNKIFIVVADHGMTAMPEDMRFVPSSDLDGFSRAAEMSCKLVLNGYNVSDVREAEQANNNLHIWELGTLFTNFAPTASGIKLLAPAELNNTGVNITQNPDHANIITALNGPMAHIYVKGVSWQSDPDQTRLGVVIDTLIRVLSMGGNASDKVKKEFGRLYASIDKILVRRTLNGPYEVVTSVGEDDSGNVTISTDSLEALNNSAYIKAGIRVTGMNHKERSGDIVLMMKDTTSGTAIDRYTTGVACKSWHGSLNPSDSYVPFIVAYPGGNKFELDPILDTVCPSNNCDGNWKLSDMVKKIIKNQYSGQ